MNGIKNTVTVFEIEELTTDDQVNEYLLTTLRTKWGADMNFIENTYNVDFTNLKRETINILLQQEKAEIKNFHLILTQKGLLLADQISADLFI